MITSEKVDIVIKNLIEANTLLEIQTLEKRYNIQKSISKIRENLINFLDISTVGFDFKVAIACSDSDLKEGSPIGLKISYKKSAPILVESLAVLNNEGVYEEGVVIECMSFKDPVVAQEFIMARLADNYVKAKEIQSRRYDFS